MNDKMGRRHPWLYLALFGFILTGAAYLRFRGQLYTEMTGDQGILYRIALDWVRGGPLPLAANKASAGIMNPPLIEYLIGLPLYLRPSLLAAARFQALLGLLTVALLYLYAAALFNQRVALVSTFFLAVNPWAVHYSRFVWNPNPVPLFSTLLLGSLLATLISERGRPWHLTLALFALAATTQLHLSSLVLVPVCLLVALLFWRRLWRGGRAVAGRAILLGILLALLLYLPYLLFQAQVGFGDLAEAVNALTGSETAAPAEFNLASWLLVQELVTGNNLHLASGAWEETVWPFSPLFSMLGLLFAGSLLYAIVQVGTSHLRRRGSRAQARSLSPRAVAYAILAVWILIPVFAYLRHTIYLQNYYFLYVWPAPFLLMALALDDGLRWAQRRLSRPVATSVTAVALSLVLLAGLYSFHVNHVGLALAESGANRPERDLGQVQEAVATSRRLLDAYPNCDLIVVAAEEAFERSTFILLEGYVSPRPVRFLQAGRGYIVPARCSLYLLTTGAPAVENWLENAGELLPETIIREDTAWRFFLVAPASTARNEPLARWENGLALLAVETPDTFESELPLSYRWHVAEEHTIDKSYHFFNHILDRDGQLVAQNDAAAIDSRNWFDGDDLVTNFVVDLPSLPPGRYTVHVGLYTWPDIVRVPLEQGTQDSYVVWSFEIPG